MDGLIDYGFNVTRKTETLETVLETVLQSIHCHETKRFNEERVKI